MTKYEEVYLINSILSDAQPDKSIDLDDKTIWSSLFLSEETKIHEDYFLELNDKGILNYEEIGEEGFSPIKMCSLLPDTNLYLKQLLHELEIGEKEDKNSIINLNQRITEILTFDPNKLSAEIKSTENIIKQTKEQINANPILKSLSTPLDQIELHFNSLSLVADNYEQIYKNIILPVKEEGRSGIRQTVRWAIISIIASTLISVVITWFSK